MNKYSEIFINSLAMSDLEKLIMSELSAEQLELVQRMLFIPVKQTTKTSSTGIYWSQFNFNTPKRYFFITYDLK